MNPFSFRPRFRRPPPSDADRLHSAATVTVKQTAARLTAVYLPAAFHPLSVPVGPSQGRFSSFCSRLPLRLGVRKKIYSKKRIHEYINSYIYFKIMSFHNSLTLVLSAFGTILLSYRHFDTINTLPSQTFDFILLIEKQKYE